MSEEGCPGWAAVWGGWVRRVGGFETTMMNCNGVNGFAMRTLRTTPSFRVTNVIHHRNTGSGPTRLTGCRMMSSVAGLGSMSITVLTAPAHSYPRCTRGVITLNVGAMSDFSVRADVLSCHAGRVRGYGGTNGIDIVSTN